MTNSPTWVNSSLHAEEALHEILKYPVCGFDTEFYGCDITTESPVGRTTCHVFSVASPSGALLPRGYHDASSWVFSCHLLTHPPIKVWLEDAAYVKAIHNQPVDAHTVRNHGVRIRGGVNTLDAARFFWPSRANGRGFSLDSLGEDFCGAGKTESYTDLFGYQAAETYEVEAFKQTCSCGVLGCRKRKAERDGTEHLKGNYESVVTTRSRKVRRLIPLTDLHEGHPLWARYMAYAAWDAVLALWVYELMMRDNRERTYPWSLL